jgi:phosphonate transport system substrate-binding protein
MAFRVPLLAAALVATLLMACGSAPSAGDADCGESGQLKVGLVGGVEGAAEGQGEGVLQSGQVFALRDQLMAASRCEVQVEPVRSPDLARARLAAQSWDIAFLPPGLMAFSLEADPPYVPLRTLGASRRSRSSIVVPASSTIRSVPELNGARVGLLPRGSLTGFYIPLYNLHGLALGKVVYALDYPALVQLLRQGEVDAIAWDEARPDPGFPLRRLVTDSHPVPLGAMVIRQSLSTGRLEGLLASLDSSARDLPPGLAYIPGGTPEEDGSVPALRAIVTHVESWNLPVEGRPYRVFARPGGAS